MGNNGHQRCSFVTVIIFIQILVKPQVQMCNPSLTIIRDTRAPVDVHDDEISDASTFAACVKVMNNISYAEKQVAMHCFRKIG